MKDVNIDLFIKSIMDQNFAESRSHLQTIIDGKLSKLIAESYRDVKENKK